jgi:hypothetical protein
MPVNIDKTLRTAVRTLEAERAHLDHQIAALKAALEITGRGSAFRLVTRRRVTTRSARVIRRRRRRMSRAARKAVSQRMKAYWGKRRAELAKDKSKRAA